MRRWKLIDTVTAFSNPWMTIRKKRYLLPGRGVEEDHYIIERRDFAVAVATRGDRLVLIRHYRPAHDRFHWELPGGGLELGEAPEAGAARELLEETGFTAVGVEILGVLHALPGYISTTGTIVWCPIGNAPQLPYDRAEVAEVTLVTWGDAVEMILSGAIDEMQTISAILLAREALARRRSQGGYLST